MEGTETGPETAGEITTPSPVPEPTAELEELRRKLEQAEKARAGAMSAKAKAEQEWRVQKETLDAQMLDLRAKAAVTEKAIADSEVLNADLAKKYKEASEIATAATRKAKRMEVATELEIPEWHDALPDTDDEAAIKAKADEIRSRLGKTLQKAGALQNLLDTRPSAQPGAMTIPQIQAALVEAQDPDKRKELSEQLQTAVRAARGLP